MKKILFTALSVILLAGCAKPEQTIENLKAAATGETHASTSYALYSSKASSEGLKNIANMFAATSYAEKRHAARHLEELAKLGVSDYIPEIDPIDVKTTAENLATAIEGEKYEFTTMYPGFIEVAQTEGATGAQIAFDWANRAEQKHAEFYTQALETLNNPQMGDEAFKVVWYVCPKCGDTYTLGTLPSETCELCGTPVSEFTEFKVAE